MSSFLPESLGLSKGGVLYDAAYGSTQNLFNLKSVIRRLPAAQFFWFDRVSSRDEAQYTELLGKLINLFITPHYFPIYPYKECSYLKKYELYTKNVVNLEKIIEHMAKLLKLDVDNIEVKIPVNRRTRRRLVVLNNVTADDMGRRSLESLIKPWLESSSSKPVLVLYLSTNDSEFRSGHATLLALKKAPDHVKYLFLNPHGGYSKKVKILNFRYKLRLKLSNICNMPVQEVLTACPALQKSVQGGNCVQWFAMIFYFLCLQPSLFEDMSSLVEELGKHPDLNVLLFSLSIFLRTMPMVGLKTYYYIMFDEHTLPFEKDMCLNEMEKLNNFLFQHFSVSNCSKFSVTNCPKSCSICEGKCIVDAVVTKAPGQDCRMLTPKEIAKQMFETYFQIKRLTRTIANEEDARFHITRMQAQYYYLKEANTLQDYVTMKLLTQEQVRDIEAQENAPSLPTEHKRKREDEILPPTSRQRI